MSGDYLWNREGSDAEVEQLERELGELEYRGQLPDLPARAERRGFGRPALLAAGLVLAAGAATFVAVSRSDSPTAVVRGRTAPKLQEQAGADGSAWGVTPISGTPEETQHQVEALYARLTSSELAS